MTIDNNIHKTVLLKILKDIFMDPTLAPYLAFKGGTAAMLFYGLSRFSVDLDFNLLDLSKEEPVFELVNRILEKFSTGKTGIHIYNPFISSLVKLHVDFLSAIAYFI